MNKIFHRRAFLKTSLGAAGVMFPAIGWGQSRPCPPSSLEVVGGTSIITGCLASSAHFPGLPFDPYFHDTVAPNFIVDPARTTNGTGSEASPFQPSQVLGLSPAVSPNGQQMIVEFLPGLCQITGSSGKFPFFCPEYSGADGAWVVFRSRNRANRATTSDAERTIFERTGGAGSYIGLGNGSSQYRRIIFDGFAFRGWHRATEGVENFTISFWNVRFCAVTRCVLDGQSLGAIENSAGSTNTGAIWLQEHQDCVIMDNHVHDLGATSGLQVWSGVEHYDGARLYVVNNDFDNIRGFGIYQKGQHFGQPGWESSTPNSGGRYARNRVTNISRNALFIISQHTGTPLGDAAWFAQNIVMNAGSAFEQHWVGTTPSGLAVVNNTFVDCAVGFNVKGYDAQYGDLYTVRNNIITGMSKNAVGVTGWGQGAADQFLPLTFVRNLYHDNAAHAGDTDDIGIDQRYDFATWRTRTYGGQLADVDGAAANPQLVNAAAGDVRLGAASPARGLGRDYLALLGGSTNASTNAGAYMTADMTDAIGRRRNV